MATTLPPQTLLEQDPVLYYRQMGTGDLGLTQKAEIKKLEKALETGRFTPANRWRYRAWFSYEKGEIAENHDLIDDGIKHFHTASDYWNESIISSSTSPDAEVTSYRHLSLARFRAEILAQRRGEYPPDITSLRMYLGTLAAYSYEASLTPGQLGETNRRLVGVGTETLFASLILQWDDAPAETRMFPWPASPRRKLPHHIFSDRDSDVTSGLSTAHDFVLKDGLPADATTGPHLFQVRTSHVEGIEEKYDLSKVTLVCGDRDLGIASLEDGIELAAALGQERPDPQMQAKIALARRNVFDALRTKGQLAESS